MSDPNRTVAASRSRKWALVSQRSTYDSTLVSEIRGEMEAAYPKPRYVVRTSRVRVGSLLRPSRVYMIRAYEVGR